MKLQGTNTTIKFASGKRIQKMYGNKDSMLIIEGFYDVKNDVIYLNKDICTKDTFVHEVAHSVFMKYHFNTFINYLKSEEFIDPVNEFMADFVNQVLEVLSKNTKVFETINKNIKNKEVKNDKETK